MQAERIDDDRVLKSFSLQRDKDEKKTACFKGSNRTY